MSQFADIQYAKYEAIRRASQGAGITLFPVDGGVCALFDCAHKIAKVLGEQHLKDWGDGIYDSLPQYIIPIDESYTSCIKLAEHHSIAIVDVLPSDDKNRASWVLMWKIPRACVSAEPKKKITVHDL